MAEGYARQMGVTILWTLGYVLVLGLIVLTIWGVARWMRAGSADPADHEIP